MSDITPEDIEALLVTFEASDWNEISLKIEGLEMFASKTPGARPMAGTSEIATSGAAPPPLTAALAPGHAASASAPAPILAPDHWVSVRAPNLGTFYKSPKPGALPYVELGQHVEATTELCLIEVMKLFTSVFAGVSGVLRQVLVDDSELVEFDQALFLIEPDA